MIYTYSICISSNTRKLAMVDDRVLKEKKMIILSKFPERIIKIDLKLRA